MVATRGFSVSSCVQSLCGLAGLALSTLAILSTTIIPARAISINDGVANATPGGVDNYFDSANVYSNVVSIIRPGSGLPSWCTGTLIDSRTVVTAAHCFFSNGVFDGGPTLAAPGNAVHTVSFGTTATTGITANNDRTVTSIVIHPGSQNEANDIAILSLSAPVTSIKPVTLFNPGTMTQPAVGSVITMVGYGGYGTGSTCCNDSDGKRRVALGALAGLMPRKAEEPGSDIDQLFYYAQFRDPLNPTRFDRFGLNLPVQALEGTTVGGDSGGPLFVVINGQLVQIGVLRGGDNPGRRASEYGDIADWTPIQLYLQWLAQNSALRSMSNKAGHQFWSDADAWSDSVAGVAARTPNNTVGNVSNYQTEIARYYNVALSNPGTVTLDQNATVDNVVITGAQSMLDIQNGFTLTAETSAGISAGTMQMSGGTLATPMLLLNGGLLTGEGTITGTPQPAGVSMVWNNGGTIAPINTLTIRGDFAQTSGTLQFRAIPAGSAGDFLSVSQTAALGGTLRTVVQPGLYNPTTSLYVLGASTVTNTFANVTSSSPFFNASAVYSANAVDVTLTRVGFGSVAGLSGNQQAVGNVLERFYSTTLTGNLATAYSNLLASPSAHVLNQLSGEAGAASAQSGVSATTQFMSTMFDAAFDGAPMGGGANSFVPAGSEALGYAASTKRSKQANEAFASVTPRDRITPSFGTRWSLWGTIYGANNRVDGDGATTSYGQVWGTVAGGDYKATPNTRLGFALGGSGSSYSVNPGLGGGKADTFHMGVYAKHNFGPAYVGGALSYAWQNVSTERLVNVGGLDMMRASFNANALTARVEGGWRLETRAVGITPYAALQTTTFWFPGYGENAASGNNTFALNFAARSVTATRAELGARWDKQIWEGSGTTFSLKARTAWAHDWNGNRSATATFQSLPGASFTVNGGTPAADAMLLSLGAGVTFGKGWSIVASYEGEYASNASTNGGKGTLKYEW